MASPAPLDVYLFPAVVGGGLGDIEETLAAGRRLAAAGWPARLYRRAGHPMPRHVDGPWEWPTRMRRTTRLAPHAPAALTVTPAWGVSAAPAREGPLGRPGPWAEEAAEIEGTYGRESTLHVSLEEFARTLSLARENRERFREGGVPSRGVGRRLRTPEAVRDAERFRSAFERFRAFDRPNVLHLFATFERDSAFAAQFPAAVQTGPLWPHRFRAKRPARPPPRRWVWYASPASSIRIAPEVIGALRSASPPVHLFVRTPRPWSPLPRAAGVEVHDEPIAAPRWNRLFRSADLRIVTGSRTFLEGLEVGGPFLYFNGVLGRGAATRRHRPEKIVAWLAAERGRLPEDLRRDLADFASARRVSDVVRRAARREGGWRRFPSGGPPSGFRPPFDDAGALIARVARRLAEAPHEAARLVARVRTGASP